MSYIEIEQVSKAYEDTQQVLKQVSLSIEKGEFVTLLGPSGCGKTTLLRSIAGLETVDSGRIYIDGVNITHLSPRQRNLAMIFQQHSLFPTMTVYDNIAFGLKLKKMPKSQIDQKVRDTLAIIDLVGSEKKYPSQLSGGEQQRVSLARCIVTDPKVLLLDEPFSAIDAKLRKSLQVKIKQIHTALGITSIFVTHDQEEAMRMSDRIYLMKDGQIEQCGSPMDLYLSPKSAYVAGFIGHYNMIEGPLWASTVNGSDPAGHYAIRPESIELSDLPGPAQEGWICLQGQISQMIYQGKVLRYTVDAADISLDVDRLFEGQCQYQRGDTVYLRIRQENIIHYSGNSTCAPAL